MGENVAENPALAEFERLVQLLKKDAILGTVVTRGQAHFEKLELDQIATLLKNDAARYFLLAAAGLNRTSLKKEAASETARIVIAPLRKAYAVRKRLPVQRAFDEVAKSAVLLRKGDLDRASKGEIEALFRDRLKAEGIPILMSPPVRQVPGILIAKRKPDGVYPDPSTGHSPLVYLEIKNVRRVADDIQKRLYEIAEASLEMKFLYGGLSLTGFKVTSNFEVSREPSVYRAELRRQIRACSPTVVVLMLCPVAEAERYREGAEAFVDRVFFQEEIDACISFLRSAVTPFSQDP